MVVPSAAAASEADAVADADPREHNDQPYDEQYEDDEIVTVEAVGSTVDEAVRKALDELDLEEDEVEIEVISEGGGSEEAHVRVTSLPYEDEDYVEQEQAGPYQEDEDEIAPPGNRRFEPEAAVVPNHGPRDGLRAPSPAFREEPRVRRFDPEAQPFAELAREVLSDLLERMQMPAEISLDAAEIDPSAVSGQVAWTSDRAGPEPADDDVPHPSASTGAPNAPTGRGADAEQAPLPVGDGAQGLPSIELSVSGEYMGILIGRHGDTLAALQFLLGVLVSRRAGRRVRVIVDVEGYRERRASLLRDMAMRAADRAQRYRQPIFLDPMIPSERRIVHLALQDHPYAATHSIGEGDSRRVVVSPKHR